MFIYLSEKTDFCKDGIKQKNILIDVDSIILIKASEEDAPENGSELSIETESYENTIEVFETVESIAKKLTGIDELI